MLLRSRSAMPVSVVIEVTIMRRTQYDRLSQQQLSFLLVLFRVL